MHGLANRLRARLPRRRQVLKVVHWTMLPLLIWFILVTPDDVVPLGRTAFLLHSNLALIFVTLSLGWFCDYAYRGLASRPGPKLPPWARILHKVMHRLILLGLAFVAFTGFLLGLTSGILLKAGGFMPIAPPMNLREANALVGQIHIVEFYILAVVIAGHAAFHIWRHVRLGDNALRIMAPKALHKYL